GCRPESPTLSTLSHCRRLERHLCGGASFIAPHEPFEAQECLVIGVRQQQTEAKVHKLLPGYMAMGETGMGAMMDMGAPKNTLPMSRVWISGCRGGDRSPAGS